MLIESVVALDVEDRLPMELFLHDDMGIRLVGRIASCTIVEGVQEKLKDMGIEFLDLKDSDRDMLESFVDYCSAIEDKSEE